MTRILQLLTLILISLVLLGGQGWAQQCVEDKGVQVARMPSHFIGASVPVAGCTPSYGEELATQNNATDVGALPDADATTGWTNSGCSPFDSIDTAPYGGTDYHIECSADGGASDGCYYIMDSLSLVNGTLYRISYYVRQVSNDTNSWDAQVTSNVASTYLDGKTISESITYANHNFYYYHDSTWRDRLYFRETNAGNTNGVYIDYLSVKTATPCLGSELNVSANAASIASEENDTTDWVSGGTNVTLSSDADNEQSGSYCIALTINADSTGAYTSTDIGTIYSLVEGEYYLISVYVKTGATYTWNVLLSPNSNSGTGGQFLVSGIVSATYVRLGGIFQYDPTKHRYLIAVESNASNLGTIYIDSLSVKPVDSK